MRLAVESSSLLQLWPCISILTLDSIACLPAYTHHVDLSKSMLKVRRWQSHEDGQQALGSPGTCSVLTTRSALPQFDLSGDLMTTSSNAVQCVMTSSCTPSLAQAGRQHAGAGRKLPPAATRKWARETRWHDRAAPHYSQPNADAGADASASHSQACSIDRCLAMRAIQLSTTAMLTESQIRVLA